MSVKRVLKGVCINIITTLLTSQFANFHLVPSHTNAVPALMSLRSVVWRGTPRNDCTDKCPCSAVTSDLQKRYIVH